MKKSIMITGIISFFLIIAGGFSFINKSSDSLERSNKGIVIDIPDDVQNVIDKSCIACHNADSRNQKAKLNLKFEYFEAGEYSPGKVVGKLNKIIETIDDGSMPPKKFNEKYPEKRMTKEEGKLLRDWADSNIKKLME
jgi:uncharacterized membrane protein